MPHFHRRTATKVRDGRVQRKNRWTPTPNNAGGVGVSIERCRPGRGYRHVVTQDEVYDFIRLVPGWDEMSVKLNRIILDSGSSSSFGWFCRGTVALCAFPSNLIVGLSQNAYYRDADYYQRFGVDCRFQTEKQPWEPDDGDEFDGCYAVCRFTRAQARCFHLTRTLLHELGHHLDLISNRKRYCSRGEEFAERMRRELDAVVWPRYVRHFGEP
jgi:hypothetical protein